MTTTKTRKPATTTKVVARPETQPAPKAARKPRTVTADTLAKVTGSRKATVTVVDTDGTTTKTTATRKPAAVKATKADVMFTDGGHPITAEAVAAMTRLERMAAAQFENDAVKAYMATAKVDRPTARQAVPTPVLDWMDVTPSADRKATRKATSTGSRARIVIDDADLPAVKKLVTGMRKDGESWKAIAAATQGTSTPLTENQVYVIAGRYGWREVKAVA